MERRILGATGISVSEMALGAMMSGAGGNPDHDESIRVIHAAIDAGINLIDTADVYSSGESETIVGQAIKDRRDDIVAPGTEINPLDNYYTVPALADSRLRRR